MPKKLTQSQIQHRLTRLNNLERLHEQDRQTKAELRAENERLKATIAEQQQTIEALRVQVAELQTMVFGKKQKPPEGKSGDSDPSGGQPKPPRDKDSYRRPQPPASAITHEETVPLPETCACGGVWRDTTEHERYREDVPLPELTPGYQAKLVTRYTVERGVCGSCGKSTSGRDLGGHPVTLGPNVRLLVCHLVSVTGMSYGQVADLLRSLYGLTVTDGEIARIIDTQHRDWMPAYQQLKADIRATGRVHADETPWAIRDNDGLGHAWVLSDSHSPRVCYALESGRGVQHARDLLGEGFDGIRVSDDYGAYRNLPGEQQLCWSHLYRVIRDLRYNTNLPEQQLPYVCTWYEQFAAIYQDLRVYLDEPYDAVVRETQADELWQRLQTLLSPSRDEPGKLTRLKTQLSRAGPDKLFACLIHDTPCDNNRAERDLRPLVLKRKRSLGSQTRKGAAALSTVLSICTTTWRTHPDDYFAALARVG